jgi:hypothetical protein
LFPELPSNSAPAKPELSIPGLLLALQLALFYFSLAKGWTAEPMAKANLGSVVPLQNCRTPQQVMECLEGWRQRLICRWDARDTNPGGATSGPAAERMRELLGQVLGRDMIGFIPVYFAVFFYGLWFGHEYVSPWKTGIFNLWWLLPLLALTTDYIEDSCHLRYRWLHWKGLEPSSLLTHFSFTMSIVKDVAAAVSFLLTIGAVLGGTWLLMAKGDLRDWRAKIALVMTIVGIAFFAIGLAFSGRHRARVRRKHRHEEEQSTAAAARQAATH